MISFASSSRKLQGKHRRPLDTTTKNYDKNESLTRIPSELSTTTTATTTAATTTTTTTTTEQKQPDCQTISILTTHSAPTSSYLLSSHVKATPPPTVGTPTRKCCPEGENHENSTGAVDRPPRWLERRWKTYTGPVDVDEVSLSSVSDASSYTDISSCPDDEISAASEDMVEASSILPARLFRNPRYLGGCSHRFKAETNVVNTTTCKEEKSWSSSSSSTTTSSQGYFC